MNKIEFQTKAQDELVLRALQLLNRPGRSTIAFKAPTGAGKTVMMANALADIAKQAWAKHNLAIIWVAPNKLHEQSYTRLRQVYGTSKSLACLLFDELSGTDIPEQSVMFVNWGSIDSDNLVLRRDNESRRNLEAFVSRAHTAGRKIVLVVDESHLHLNSGEQAQVVVDHILKPDLLIEVSATPKNTESDASITVLREDVVNAGFIRKRIVVNPGEPIVFDGKTLTTEYSGTSENLLDLALQKQAELTRLFRAAGSKTVPLVLVQLPDKRNTQSEDLLARFERHLQTKHDLSRGSGVAVWLSGDRTPELDNIASSTSNVRVLFFKQAIATGWDCPRAQILVGLREMKSETFTTQVLGRIIRQPEHKHYAEDSLNYGYVFTNYERMELDPDTVPWLGKVVAKAKGSFDLPFQNWTEQRVDRRGYLNAACMSTILSKKAVLKGSAYQGPVMANLLHAVDIEDLDHEQSFVGSNLVPLDLQGLQQRMDAFKSELVTELADQGRGGKYVDKALRDAAAELVESDDEQRVLETVLHEKNQPFFRKMVEDGVKEFLLTLSREPRKLDPRAGWSAPQTRFLELSDPLDGYSRCLYTPLLAGQFERSNVEEPFSRLLDQDPAVAVWFKNGDSGQEHFAILYELDGEQRLFYPDFIVRTVKGGIRLYDTKGSGASDLSTGNMRDTHAKARALAAYTEGLRQKGHDVAGGIVVRKDEAWWLHAGANYPGTIEVSETTGWAPWTVLG